MKRTVIKRVFLSLAALGMLTLLAPRAEARHCNRGRSYHHGHRYSSHYGGYGGGYHGRHGGYRRAYYPRYSSHYGFGYHSPGLSFHFGY